ncbi:hypothetical protein SK128_009164 [Halocaridina rubra]|uniref:Uncharacterized protein n=1 Tax=Halocaridina rubra TaxID=373956 RepID=A0AAN8ZQK7_HALRR
MTSVSARHASGNSLTLLRHQATSRALPLLQDTLPLLGLGDNYHATKRHPPLQQKDRLVDALSYIVEFDRHLQLPVFWDSSGGVANIGEGSRDQECVVRGSGHYRMWRPFSDEGGREILELPILKLCNVLLQRWEGHGNMAL